MDNKVSILVSFPGSHFGEVALMGALSYNEFSAWTVPTTHRFWQPQAARRQTKASGCHNVEERQPSPPRPPGAPLLPSLHPLGPPVNYTDEQNGTNPFINTSFIYRCRDQAHTYLFIHLENALFLLCTSLVPPPLLWPQDCQTCNFHLFIMPASPMPAVQGICLTPLIHYILFVPTKHT